MTRTTNVNAPTREGFSPTQPVPVLVFFLMGMLLVPGMASRSLTAQDASPAPTAVPSAALSESPTALDDDLLSEPDGWSDSESDSEFVADEDGVGLSAGSRESDPQANESEGEVSVSRFPIAAPEPMAAGCLLTANESLWGSFTPGSWIRTRTTSVSTEGNKNARSVTETKWTLLAIEADGIRLRKEVSIRLGSVNHATPAEEVRLDFFDVPIVDRTEVREQPSTGLNIARKVIPCNVREYIRTGDQKQEETQVWYSSVVTPHILQKESRTWSVDRNAQGVRTLLCFSQTTIARTSAHLRLGNTLGTWRAQTKLVRGQSETVIKTYYSSKVPGGVIKETSVETGADGKVLYHASTVLLDYFAKRD